MKETGLRAVLRRELAWLAGSRAERCLWIWSPLAALLIVISLFSSGLPTRLPLAVVDLDGGPQARELLRRLDAVPALEVRQRPPSLEAAWTWVRRGEAYAVLEIPRDWSREALRGPGEPVVLYNNTQYYLIAGVISTGVREALASMAGEQQVLREARFGGGLGAAAERVNALGVRLRTLFNPQISYELYLGGMLVMILLHLYLVVMAVSQIGREFRNGTAAGWLATAGGSLPRALLGKLAPAAVLHLALGLALIAWYASLSGGLAAVFLLRWGMGWGVFVLASLALALLLGSLTPNMRLALSVTGIVVGTSAAFSGFTFPLVAMSTGARAWALALPLTHYLQLQQGQWMSGASAAAWAGEMATLAGMTLLCTLAGALCLRALLRAPQRWGGR